MAKSGYPPTPLHERFDAKYIAVGSDGCWPWTSSVNCNGYGKISVSRSTWTLAHRVSWELHHGAIPDGMFVCHHCDNPLCVNPDHLFLGSHEDNMRDMVEKGRSLSGERHNMAKLTNEQVTDIRSLAGAMPQAAIGARFGVSQGHISRLLCGEGRAA